MYAVIAVGGKQLKVHEGDTIRVERLPGKVGDTVALTEVLLVHTDDGTVSLGTPTIEGATVSGDIVGHGRGKKVVIFKHKRRKNYRRKQGHRQPYTALKITGIDVEDPARRRTKRAAEASQPDDGAPGTSQEEA